jgi:hypothetical protein
MSSRRKSRLKRAGKNELVAAEIVDALSKDELLATHLDWEPERLEALKELLNAKEPWPEHWHWDWSKKAGLLDFMAYRCMGIECEGRMQGLLMASTLARSSRVEPTGKAVLFVEYIESAPWNLKDLVDEPKFSGVGIALLEAAIELSEEEGFGGRIGLHSLPQSEAFYRKYMTDLGPDAGHQGLHYFEMSAEQARLFLEGRK